MLATTRRRLLTILFALPVILALTAFTYMAGMRFLEGEERSFWQALEWAAETLTTTGYGRDMLWQHPLMVLIVVGVQFSGVFLVYFLVPLLLIPYVEERFRTKLPDEVPEAMTEHVVIFRWGPAGPWPWCRASAASPATSWPWWTSPTIASR